MRSNAVFILFLIAMSGCTTPGYKLIPAQAINPTAQTPRDIGSDALEISKFHVFDDSTFSRIQTAIIANQGERDKANAVRGVLCDGRKPKVKAPELFVTLVIPKGDPQDSIETISRRNQEFLKLARLYLKRWLIMDASTA